MILRAVLIVTLSLGLPAAGQLSSLHRHSASDLEVTLGGRHGSASRRFFLSQAYLASLPQVLIVTKQDLSFMELPLAGTRITGVDINVLLNSVSPLDPSAALIAICRDGYTSSFPRSAVLDHHPILVLTIDGISLHRWAVKHHAYDPGPYFVTYAHFVPSFHLLAHEDFAQHPAEIVRLRIVPAADLFRTITPPTPDLAATDPVSIGFHIAQQNCFRCHNSGDTGGTKAQRTWRHLAEVAKSRPKYFASWVHNPQSIDPHAKMTPNLQYDQPTLDALTRYFQVLAP